jgi:serine/threonine protein kinase
VAKLCDFGLSVNTEFMNNQDAPKYYGTPRWRAPEVLRQDNKKISPRDFHLCDIFSLGLVIWSTFAQRGHPVITEFQEKMGFSFSEVVVSLQSTTGREYRQTLSSTLLEQLLKTIKGTLDPTPSQRDKKAWKYLLQNPERSRSSTREYQE